MEMDSAKNLVNETGAEKRKTLFGAVAIGLIVIVGIIVVVSMSGGSKKDSESGNTDGDKETEQAANFFENNNQIEAGNAHYTKPEELFEKDSSISKEEKLRMIEMAEHQGSAAMPKEEDSRIARDNERLRQELEKERMRSNRNNGSSMPVPVEYSLPAEYRKRLNKDYQDIVGHYRKTQNLAWQIERSSYDREIDSGDKLSKVEHPLRDLYEGAGSPSGYNLMLGAGTRLIAVTEQEVNSDHQGLFTAKIVRPMELKGAKLLCESGANVRDRIPVRAIKLIHSGVEYKLSGQVEMKYPGMSGKVFNNWYKRLGPELINTAIGAGFMAWTASNYAGDDVRIDTRDAISGPIIQQSVGGLQDEISRLGGDVPNTVVVKSGTQFAFLLSEKLEISL